MRHGFRGYIASRPINGTRYPQRIQNLVIRDYTQRKNLEYLLSSAEWSIPGCYEILEEILTNLSALEGVVLFSMFMLPERKSKRHEIYSLILDSGVVLHSALEGAVIESPQDIEYFEDIIEISNILQNTSVNDAYMTSALTIDRLEWLDD